MKEWFTDYLSKFYNSNYRKLLASLRKYGLSLEDREDILQEAFTRAILYRTSFSPSSGSLGSWFSTILNNTRIQFQVNQVYTAREEEGYLHHTTNPDMIAKQINDMAIKEIGEVDNLLHRKILHDSIVLGYNGRETAERNDCKEPMVYQVIRRWCNTFIKENGLASMRRGYRR